MGYIDENLMSGEQVVYRTKLHLAVFLWPVVIALIAIFSITSIGGVLLLVAIIWGISAFVSYKTSEFGITNKRVLMKFGFIRRNSLETLLSKVEGIQVHQGIIGRMLNYGTIVVKGIGGTSNPFHKIELPFEFRKKVQEQIALMQQ